MNGRFGMEKKCGNLQIWKYGKRANFDQNLNRFSASISKVWYYVLNMILVVVVQLKFVPLYDYSYIVNVSGRMASGQSPYRDFDLTTTPGAYLLARAAFYVFGWRPLALIILSCLTSGVALFCTLRILKRQTKIFSEGGSAQINLVYLSSALMGVNNIIAFPFYDNFAITMVLISICFCDSMYQGNRSRLISYLAGLSIFIPFFFKQNIGVFYVIGIIFTLTLNLYRKNWVGVTLLFRQFKNFAIAVVSGLLILLIYFLYVAPLQTIYFQLFTYAGKSKGLLSKNQLFHFYDFTFVVLIIIFMLISTKKFFWVQRSINFILILLIGIISVLAMFSQVFKVHLVGIGFQTPKLVGLWLLGLGIPLLRILSGKTNKKSKYREGIILIFLFVLFGTFLSQGFWGSFYATGPLLILIIFVGLFESIKTLNQTLRLTLMLCVLCFSLWFSLYGLKGDQLLNTNITMGQHSISSKFNYLRLLPLRKNELTDIENLSQFLSNETSTVLEVPMEDPLPFIDRNYSPWGRCAQAIFLVCTSSPRELSRFRSSPPALVVVKTIPQWNHNWEPLSDEIIKILEKCKIPSVKIGRYQVYRPKSYVKCISNIN
jgi:hypothetical protein